MYDPNVEISVIVPCYNEEDVLLLFYREVKNVLENTLKLSDYEICFIDDGSKDKTLEIVKKLGNDDSHVIFVSFTRNFGKEAGIYAGLKYSRGRYVVIMDADLQDPPSMIPTMYSILNSGEYDSVAVCRTTRSGEPVIRSFFSRCFYSLINKISSVEIKNGARDFRMMNRKTVDHLIKVSEYNRFSKGLFQFVGGKTYWLSYENKVRAAGTTKWSFWNLLHYAIDGIVNFSDAPLSISTAVGLFITLFSFIWVIVLIAKKIIIGNYNVSGWTSAVCIILFLGGVQLLSIGIIGQYISRIFLETKNRPIFLVSETNASDDDTDEKDGVRHMG